jgi:integrase
MNEWKWKINRKAALVLIEVAETGTFQWSQVPHYNLSCGSSELDAVRKRYLQQVRERNLEPTTICLHDYVFRFGLKHAGIDLYRDLEKLNAQKINQIIEGFSNVCNARSVSTILPILRAILRFFQSEGIVNQDFSGMVMQAYGKKNRVRAFIPTAEDEILEKALEKERSRNRAIILLALKLGLRDIDICLLKFENIDWKRDQIRIVQKKTDVPLTLPLLPVVGNAIMAYILEDRPQPEDGYPYVFRRKQAPYYKIRSAYPICSNFLERNKIHVFDNASKGVHVFRYTLVNRLLRAKISHQVITDTLGHTSKESDKPYLSMEADTLRQCSLDLSLTGTITWKEVRT